MNIRIGNLHASLIESDLHRLFSSYGEVEAVHLLRDKFNNRSRGSAFIEMPVDKQARLAISGLHATAVKGKMVSVVEVGYNPTPDAWTFDRHAL